MENQSFTIEITQSANASPAFITKCFVKVLKAKPELIPILLDATGKALLKGSEPSEVERLAILQGEENDEDFFMMKYSDT